MWDERRRQDQEQHQGDAHHAALSLGQPTGTEALDPPEPAALGAATRPLVAVGEGFATSSWFTPEEVAAIRKCADEELLTRCIAHSFPGETEEETLFRRLVAGAVLFGDWQVAPPPAGVGRLLELSRSVTATPADYAEVVGADPTLARPVLNLASSSFYTGLPPCQSVAHAMVRIGMREVERISLLLAFETHLFPDLRQDALARIVRRHSWACALAAHAVARRTETESADAFLGGLFHDVGKLAVLSIVAEVRGKLDRAPALALVMSAVEGLHALAGESVCRSWGLHPAITRVIARHHDAAALAQDALGRAVHLGNRLAQTLEGAAPLEIASDDPALTAARLAPEDLWELGAQVEIKLAEFRQALT